MCVCSSDSVYIVYFIFVNYGKKSVISTGGTFVSQLGTFEFV